MRTTDDLNPAPPWQPLGERVTPPPLPAADPKRIAPGIVEAADGRMHTDLPLPKDKP